MARKPQQKRSIERKSAILDAGFTSLKLHGIDGTTTKHIADLAGVSVGSVYEYFSSKEDIYAQMTQLFADQIVEMIKKNLPQVVDLSLGEAARFLLHRYKELLEQDNQRFLQLLRHQSRFAIDQYVKEAESSLMAFAMSYINKHPELLKINDLMTHSYVLINAAVFSVVRFLSESSNMIEFDRVVEVVVQIIENHIAAMIAKS